MEKRKKRRGRGAYTEEFRREAVRLVEQAPDRLWQIARDLDVHHETLQSWWQRAQAAGDAPIVPPARVLTLEEENRRLRQENARLAEERDIPKKSGGLLRQGYAMRFAFIQAHAGIWHVRTMCRVLEVSKAGYYAWRARPVCARRRSDVVLTAQLRVLHHGVKQRYGSPRLQQELRARGVVCGKNRVARLMRAAGLRAKSVRRFRVTTQARHRAPVAPNLLARRFAVASHPQPNQTWAADITYLGTREGWLYLAVVLDLASRRVVGWALRTRLDQELALAALDMALTHRRVTSGGLHHSDRGVQYASAAYQQALQRAGFTGSMSRVGDCWDNAVVESFFATLTKELLVDGDFPTRAAACRAVFEFIEIWYNRKRRHSSLAYRTPQQYEDDVLKVG
ncbi:MAG TPA: IS3 family transposase [Burkholderiales bacterium]|nr:IS3 family transposase [Burkholderiales bacterium]